MKICKSHVLKPFIRDTRLDSIRDTPFYKAEWLGTTVTARCLFCDFHKAFNMKRRTTCYRQYYAEIPKCGSITKWHTFHLSQQKACKNFSSTESSTRQTTLLAVWYQQNYWHLYLRIVSSLLKLYKSYMDLGREYTNMNQKYTKWKEWKIPTKTIHRSSCNNDSS